MTDLRYEVAYMPGRGWRWFAYGPSWHDMGYAATRWGAERRARRACRRRIRDLARIHRPIRKRYAPTSGDAR